MMNVVFMNSLERRSADNRVVTAQVAIGESGGVWRVLWTEPDPSGVPAQTVWFEGGAWNEMLNMFRKELLQKMAEGYAPLLGDVAGDVQSLNGRAEWAQKLYYYSELHRNETVFGQLKDWRRKQAAKEKKAPYLIGTNRMLGLIAAFLPQTQEELMQLPGLGPYKAGLYGSDMLAVAAQVQRDTAFPLDWVEGRIDYAQYKLWLYQQQQSYEERGRQRKERKHAVLEGAARGDEVEQLAQSVSLTRREVVAMLEQLEREGYDVEPTIRAELTAVPAEQRERIMAMFRLSGERYLKPIWQKLVEEGMWKDVQVDRAYELLRLHRIHFHKEKEADAAPKAG